MSGQVVIGASGQVGEHLVQAASAAGLDVLGTYSSHPVPGLRQLDIRNRAETRSLLLASRPSVVYLPAARANVDYCELHPEEGYAVNVLGVRHVVQAANEIGAKLVFFSSDYIFDGRAGPYREGDPPNPICEYGRQKLMAEHCVALHARNYLVVRTTVVYGRERQRKNFIYRLLETLRDGQVLRAPVDQVGSPTYAPNLAQTVVALALADAVGVFHVAGPERASRYEFACEAARAFGLDQDLIRPVATRELGQAAARPLDAGMLVEKATRELTIPLVAYPDGLRAMAAEESGGHSNLGLTGKLG
ncbi:MAG: SDR family oxidoreductase [Chloroflexi bacterium]|nr:SDR family oxidoreductase [Chloroflexota bacterium]